MAAVAATTAFVWIWLPGATEPVVAGRLDQIPGTDTVTFAYGRRYLDHSEAIAVYLPDLPLTTGAQAAVAGPIPGPIGDAGPDAWGRRVIENRLAGEGGTTDLGFLTLLLESGSDRVGALDFQASPDLYVPRLAAMASLTDLAGSAARVEAGEPLSPGLDEALLRGSSIGGARPKSGLVDGDRHLIAKFASSTDTYPVVQAEYVAMDLARRAGLHVAPVNLTTAMGRHVLLVERFDRPGGGQRRAVVSALTILGLDELGFRYGSYADLADLIRRRFTHPEAALRELFARITFNILVSNSDDHPRNHAAFWDGTSLTLTPAYDICPQPRSGGETAQAMAIGRNGYRYAQLAGCVAHAEAYLLTATEAREIIDAQRDVIHTQWEDVTDRAELTSVDRERLWRRQFLNPYALDGY